MNRRQILFILGLGVFPALALAGMNCSEDSGNRFPCVVRLEVPDAGWGYCTGTVFRKKYILTAAHCLYVRKRDRSTVPIESSRIGVFAGPDSAVDLGKVSSIKIHPEYARMQSAALPGVAPEGIADFDLAVIELKKETPESCEISYEPLRPLDKLAVGGYGMTRLRDPDTADGNRRMGEQSIGDMDGKKICLPKSVISEDRKKLKSGSGCQPMDLDTGGPFLFKGKIRAVQTSTVENWKLDGNTDYKACALNIENPNLKEFIEGFRSDAPSPGASSRGNGPAAGARTAQ